MEQKGSFIGFTFGNRHSSKLGILRTSNSDRYEDHFITSTDVTTEVPGQDGLLHWRSNYSKREIPISFAFYGLTEEQLTQLKRVFNDKKIHDLILDEEPYKVWSAKLTGVATVRHLCLEHEGQRFYCGEGTFTFTSYTPFARSRYKYIEDYTEENVPEWNEDNKLLRDEFEEGIIYPAILSYDFPEDADTATIVGTEIDFYTWLDDVNLLSSTDLELSDINSCIRFFKGNTVYYNLDEWREASKIPNNVYAGYPRERNGMYHIYNAGDIEMPFTIKIPISSYPESFNISCGSNELNIGNVVAKDGDTHLIVDTKRNILVGYNKNLKKETKNLYNKYITSGDFFKIPIQKEVFMYFPVLGTIEFNYLYL